MKLSRRSFIKSSSAGIATISGLMPNLLSAQTAIPKRKLLIVSLGHSLDPISGLGRDQWIPAENTSGIAAMSNFMSPLNPFRDKMLAVAGVDNIVPDLVSSNGHNASSRTILTALPHAEFSGRGSSMDTQSRGGGPSIEYVLALRRGERPFTLRAGVTNAEHRRTFLPDGSDDQGNPDPRSAFENLFVNFEPGSTSLSPAEKLQARRADILSAVRNTYESTAIRVRAADREQLQSHANLIDNFISELNTSPATGLCNTVPTLNVPTGFPQSIDRSEHHRAGRSDHLIAPLHHSAIAAAFGCGAASVASLHYSTMQNNQFPFLNSDTDLIAPYGVNWHAFCHHDGGTTNEIRVLAQRWYFEMFADLLTKLEQTPDINGSVLDNTLVVILSSLGAASHSTYGIPFILFGGANSGIHTNRVIDYRSSPRTTGDMWTSILQIMGETDEHFGYQGEINGRVFNSGPLTNIMKS